jgi:protoporphyrinogen/coproporphyrinogen III oxidase
VGWRGGTPCDASLEPGADVIAVIGGGISGLAVGYHLDRAGAECVVLEGTGRAGGVLATVRAEGRVLELGPQRTRLTAPLRRMSAELGLADRVVVAPPLPLYVYRRGRLHEAPLTLRGALTTGLIGWRDRLRILAEPITAPLGPDETAADFFTRKFGRRTYDRVIAPLYGGLYASDPAEMPARHALAPLLDAAGARGSLLAVAVRGARAASSAPACSFDGGLQVLTDALAARLADRLQRNAPVRAVSREGARLRVRHERGDVLADRIVLACPAGSAATILADLDPDAASRVAGLRYNRLAVVHLMADAKLRGLGYQVALDEVGPAHGAAWNHPMFGAGREGIHTVFLGGAHRQDVVGRPDEELARLATDHFQAVTGAAARALHVHRTHMPAWDRSWDALDGMAWSRGVAVCANWWGRPGITGRLAEAERLATRLAGELGAIPDLVPA